MPALALVEVTTLLSWQRNGNGFITLLTERESGRKQWVDMLQIELMDAEVAFQLFGIAANHAQNDAAKIRVALKQIEHQENRQ